MQTREKRLALAFGAVIALYFLRSTFGTWVTGPLDDRRIELTAQEARAEKANNARREVLAAMESLSNWKRQSLPPDPTTGSNRATALTAQRLYQDWLTDVARECGMTKLDVTPGPIRASGDTFLSVQVHLNAEARFPEIARFLALLRHTELLHHVQECRIEGEEHDGNPPLTLRLTTEGVALREAPPRSRLFPETTLAAAVTPQAEQITVATSEGFPQTGGFRIRIGEELLTVNKVDGTRWSVRRGIAGSKAIAHAAQSTVDLGLRNPLSGLYRDDPLFAGADVVSPFAKPVPPREYQPQLQISSRPIAERGRKLEFTVQPRDFNPLDGKPLFALSGKVPEGMSIDPQSGVVQWMPPATYPLGMYEVAITATQGTAETPSATTLVSVNVRDPNEAPVIRPFDPQTVYHGRTLLVVPQVKDEDIDDLTWSLVGTPPAGLELDPERGTILWTPTETVPEGAYEVTLKATDAAEPPLSTETKLQLAVKADAARHTHFIGMVSGEGRPEAWFNDRWNNKQWIVREGEKLSVADVEAVVQEVSGDSLLLESGDQTWRVELGNNLRSMVPWPSKRQSQADTQGAVRAADQPAG